MNKFICILTSLAVALGLFADQVISTSITNEWPDERYEVHGDGTVTDRVTGLMWMRCSIGQDHNDNCSGSATEYNWQEALEFAEDYSLGIYTDWRLPNIKELDSLAALDRYDPAINSTVFPNTPSARYWSASPYAEYVEYALQLYFDHGGGNPVVRSYDGRVRLVRSEQ